MALVIYIQHFIFGTSLNAFTCIFMGKCSSPAQRNLDYNYGVVERLSEHTSAHCQQVPKNSRSLVQIKQRNLAKLSGPTIENAKQ